MPIDCENKEIEMQLDKVYNMDCMDLLPQIENESIDMIITDPPYTTPTVTAFGREKVKNVGDLSIQESYIKTLKREFERILKPKAPVFMFCDDTYYPSIFRAFYDWNNVNLLVWLLCNLYLQVLLQ